MIHPRPNCFDCELPIERDDQIVWASPMRDDDPTAPSASFHGLCLMRWRERRDTALAAMREAHQAFLRHLGGECSCGD